MMGKVLSDTSYEDRLWDLTRVCMLCTEGESDVLGQL